MIALDTETTGLDPRADRLVLVGVAGDGGEPLVLRHDDDRELIQAAARHRRARSSATTSASTWRSSRHAGYRIPPPERWDRHRADRARRRRAPAGPDQAAARSPRNLIELGELPGRHRSSPRTRSTRGCARARRAARKERTAGGPEKGHAPRDLLDPYLRRRRRLHARRARLLRRRASTARTRSCELERRCMPAVYAAEQRGVPLDLDAAHELRDRTARNVARPARPLFELAGRTFNVNSARQIEQALRDRGVDLDEVPRTPRAGQLPMLTAQRSKRHRRRAGAHAAGLPRREEARRLRRTACSQHTHGDRLYGAFHQVGTDTGRMSSSRPNLQNIPKHRPRVRYVIAAGDGKTLVGADLDNVELRVLACYAPGGALERRSATASTCTSRPRTRVGVDRDARQATQLRDHSTAPASRGSRRSSTARPRRGQGGPGPLVRRATRRSPS